MTKIAKLVRVSLMTRVIVDDNATEKEILELCQGKFIEKIECELGENLEEIVDDEESPYDVEFDGGEVVCLNCGFDFFVTKLNTSTDALGRHCTCPKCSGSFDIPS